MLNRHHSCQIRNTKPVNISVCCYFWRCLLIGAERHIGIHLHFEWRKLSSEINTHCLRRRSANPVLSTEHNSLSNVTRVKLWYTNCDIHLPDIVTSTVISELHQLKENVWLHFSSYLMWQWQKSVYSTGEQILLWYLLFLRIFTRVAFWKQSVFSIQNKEFEWKTLIQWMFDTLWDNGRYLYK